MGNPQALNSQFVNFKMKFSMLAIAAAAIAGGVNGFSGPSFAVRSNSALMMSAATEADTKSALAVAANGARGLALDSIVAAHSGHMGLPLGAAEVGSTLWANGGLKYNAKDPQWVDRDRFILSAGHGSMFLYSWLHMAGYDLPMEEVKNFRQHHSMTPGHPEFPNSEHNTPGIESTTGPLGQGVANAVGFAVSAKMAEARYNTDSHTIFDHHIYALAGDGCFQEGVSAESAAFAAHEKLDNLIILYDANEVTLDKMAEYTQSEDIIKRYEAYGWDVYDIDGHDLDAVDAAISSAKSTNNGKPKFIKCNTIIGKGMEETEGTNAAHGEAGIPYVAKAKKNIGLPEDESWYVSDETRAFFDGVQKKNTDTYDAWQTTYGAWAAANPEMAKELTDSVEDNVIPADEMMKTIP